MTLYNSLIDFYADIVVTGVAAAAFFECALCICVSLLLMHLILFLSLHLLQLQRQNPVCKFDDLLVVIGMHMFIIGF